MSFVVKIGENTVGNEGSGLLEDVYISPGANANTNYWNAVGLGMKYAGATDPNTRWTYTRLDLTWAQTYNLTVEDVSWWWYLQAPGDSANNILPYISNSDCDPTEMTWNTSDGSTSWSRPVGNAMSNKETPSGTYPQWWEFPNDPLGATEMYEYFNQVIAGTAGYSGFAVIQWYSGENLATYPMSSRNTDGYRPYVEITLAGTRPDGLFGVAGRRWGSSSNLIMPAKYANEKAVLRV